MKIKVETKQNNPAFAQIDALRRAGWPEIEIVKCNFEVAPDPQWPHHPLLAGIYWVKDRHTNSWVIAKWVPNQNWWVLAFIPFGDPSQPSGCVSIRRFDKIGPMIIAPNDSADVDPAAPGTAA